MPKPLPRSIPWLLVAIGIGFTLLTAWSFQRAVDGVSRVTDRDYYSHGLRYDRSLLEQQRAESLGWQMTSSLTAGGVQLTLTNRDGGPVAGARATAAVFHPAGGEALDIPVRETAPGRYLLALPAESRGEITVDVAFSRDGASLGRRLLVALPRR